MTVVDDFISWSGSAAGGGSEFVWVVTACGVVWVPSDGRVAGRVNGDGLPVKGRRDNSHSARAAGHLAVDHPSSGQSSYLPPVTPRVIWIHSGQSSGSTERNSTTLWGCSVDSTAAILTRSHPVMVGDMSRVTLNFDLSKIPFVHF